MEIDRFIARISPRALFAAKIIRYLSAAIASRRGRRAASRRERRAVRTTRIGGSSRTSWSPRSAARGAARDRGAIRAAGDARGAFRGAAVGTEDRAEEATAREDAPDARARTTRAATIARGAAVVAAMTVCESDAVLEPSCDDRSARGREWRATWSTSARRVKSR